MSRERQKTGSVARTLPPRLLREDGAQSMAEYALFIALVTIVALAAVTLLGGNISTLFNGLASSVLSAGS
jgi:Flp pilus assembly pilin Flp